MADAEGGCVPDAWVDLARMCRFLTGDDSRATGFLERLAFYTAGDAWVDVFGDRGRARIQAEKDALLAQIDRAFDGIPFPGPSSPSLYQAQAADRYSGCDQSRDHKGRWQDLPRHQLLECDAALPHIRAGSLPYYLPALMSLCVREHDRAASDPALDWLLTSVRFHFGWTDDDPRLQAYMRERHAGLTRAQLAAIHRFTVYFGIEPRDAERWRRLAEGAAWEEVCPAAPQQRR